MPTTPIKIFLAEWKRHARNKTHQTLMMILCALVLGTLFVHSKQKTTLNKAQINWQKTTDELWANQPKRHPHRVSHYGHVVVRPQAPLSFIEPGASPYIGNYLFLEAHQQNSSSIQSSAINPATFKLGFPSTSNLILILWPLLLIILGFGSFSHEWDTQRLYYLSSLGTSIWDLFLGKLSVLIIYTVILLTILGATSMGLLVFYGDFRFDLLLDLFALLAFFALYTIFWLSLIFCISFYSRSSHQSLWRLLTVWILLIIVIPKMSVGFSQIYYPLPDRANFTASIEKAVHAVGDAHNPKDPYFNEFKLEILNRYNVKKIEDLPVNWNGLVMAEGERITSEIFKKYYQKITSQLNAQDKLRLWLSLLSPMVSIQYVLQKITRTDRESSNHFEQAAETFRYNLIQKLNHLHAHEIKQKNDRAQKLSARTWQEMKLFNYSPPNNRRINFAAILSILIWSCFSIVLIFKFRRMEVSK